MSTIFISHSSQDNDLAREVAERLAAWDHHSVFLDLDPEKGIIAGQSWEQTLYRKLRACRAVIALCTDNYLDSHWCFAEVALARMEGKHIIALVDEPFGPDAKLPSILTDKQYIDVRRDRDARFERVRKGLEEEDILGVAGDWDPNEPPYLGLSAFQEEHAPVFFGREDEIRSGLEMLDRGAPGLTMVLGASGSGKSSLVRAGLLPRLRREPKRWLVVDPMRPGADPFRELATSIAQAYRRYAPEHAKPFGEWEFVRERLIEDAKRLAHATPIDDSGVTEPELQPEREERLRRLIAQLEELRAQPDTRDQNRLANFLDWSIEDLRRICESPSTQFERAGAKHSSTAITELMDDLKRFVPDRRDAQILIIVDQFEELLGHEDEATLPNLFLDLIRRTAEIEHVPVMILGTMRSDFLGVFQRNAVLRRIDFASLSIGPMSREGMLSVIEEPAKRGAITLKGSLAQKLLNDTETPDALPLLSFTLWKLWRDHHEKGEIREEDYVALGGLHGAVAREADAILASAKREDRAAIQRAFLQMVRVTEDDRYARKPASWDDPKIAKVHSTIKRFEERRLVFSRMQDGIKTLEVAHEALFRSWEPLAKWLDEYRTALLLQQQISRDATTWNAGGQTDDTLLWRGGRLQQSHELQKADELDIGSLEVSFIQAGLREQRNRRIRIIAVTTAIATALTSLTVFSVFKKLEADRERAAALDLARVAVATQLADQDANHAALVLAEVENPRETDFAGREMRNLLNAGLSIVLNADAAIRHAEFSSDGSRIAGASENGTAWVWNADGSGRPVLLDGHGSDVVSVSFSPDGRSLVTASEDGTAIVWNVQAGDSVVFDEHGASHVNRAVFSQDGRRVATASNDGTVRMWNADGSGTTTTLGTHGNFVKDIVFSPDGNLLASASFDSTARVWDLSQPDEPYVATGHRGWIVDVNFSPRGDRFVTASFDSTARVWSSDGSRQPIVLRGHSDVVISAEFSPEGQHIVTASRDRTARVWDSVTGDQVGVFAGHTDSLTSATFHPAGDRILTSSADRTARLWYLDGLRETVVFGGHTDRLRVAAFSPTGDRIMTASLDGTVRVWHPEKTPDPQIVYTQNDRLVAAAIDPAGEVVATIDAGGLVSLIDLSAGATPVTLGVHDAVEFAASFSPDGRTLITASPDERTVMLWSVEDRSAISEVDALAVAFDPNGSMRAVALPTNVIVVESVSDASSSVTLGEMDQDVATVAFSANGERVVATSWDGAVKVWRVDGRGEPVSLTHHTTKASATFGPDHRRLVTASWDSTAVVWDVGNGRVLANLVGHGGTVDGAIVSTDGSRIVTHSHDGTARVWGTKRDKWSPENLLDPVILEPGTALREPVIAAGFTQSGEAVLTVSADGTIRRWSTISHELLQSELQRRTNLCLDVQFRRQRLGQSEEEAAADFAACERRNNRSGP